MTELGRILVLLGAALFVAGLLVVAVGRMTALHHLPGDLSLQRGSYTFSFPLASSVLASIALTLLFNVLLRLFR